MSVELKNWRDALSPFVEVEDWDSPWAWSFRSLDAGDIDWTLEVLGPHTKGGLREDGFLLQRCGGTYTQWAWAKDLPALRKLAEFFERTAADMDAQLADADELGMNLDLSPANAEAS